MKHFSSYLRSRRYAILAFIVSEAVFSAFFFLYRLPLPVILYPLALASLSGGIFLAVGYLGSREKYKDLMILVRSAAETIGELPVPDDPAEEAYREMVLSLKDQCARRDEAAQEKYRDMTEYYTVWAHQIKTPIAAMKLALENEDSPLSRRLGSDLLRVERYVEMVLTFLRLDSENTDYVFRECSLDEIIRREIRSFATEFITKRLELNFTPTGRTLVTDEKWLGFVIGQLLSNSLKYTGEGGITIFMKEPEVLCISDTGIGISASDLPRIFERGYTGFNGRENRQSSGIGLWLCRRVCENLGIGISADSAPGEGTSVYLDLSQYRLRKE